MIDNLIQEIFDHQFFFHVLMFACEECRTLPSELSCRSKELQDEVLMAYLQGIPSDAVDSHKIIEKVKLVLAAEL